MLPISMYYMETIENAEKTRLFAYVRESVKLDSGIKIQKEKIQKYCEAYNIDIVKWFIENDASAFKPRSKYNRMMDELYSDDTINGIVCSSLTRFGRKAGELIKTNEDMIKQNKKLVMIDNNIDSSTINGKAMLGVMSIFAELERDTIFERITAGRKHAAEVGSKSGLPLNRPRLQIDWKEYDKWYKLGLSTNAISKIITDVRTGKPVSSSALYNAVKERNKQHDKKIR